MTGGLRRQYIVDNALSVLESIETGSVDVIHLDDAWERPRRCDYGNESASGTQAAGTSYDTHPFEGGDVSTRVLLDESYRVLSEGGWILVTCDDWLLTQVVPYLQDEWGNVVETYRGGGLRRVGGVTYITKSDGTPDRSTAGHYLTNGGYPVVFAHKGETERKTTTSARQLAHQVRAEHDYDSEKPIKPYRRWLDGLTEQGDWLVEPCAGTAPACCAMEQLYGEQAEWTAIDIANDAKKAYERRRADEVL